MPNQRRRSHTMVPNGTAPLEDFPQMKKFRMKQVTKTSPGYKVAVYENINLIR